MDEKNSYIPEGYHCYRSVSPFCADRLITPKQHERIISGNTAFQKFKSQFKEYSFSDDETERLYINSSEFIGKYFQPYCQVYINDHLKVRGPHHYGHFYFNVSDDTLLDNQDHFGQLYVIAFRIGNSKQLHTFKIGETSKNLLEYNSTSKDFNYKATGRLYGYSSKSNRVTEDNIRDAIYTIFKKHENAKVYVYFRKAHMIEETHPDFHDLELPLSATKVEEEYLVNIFKKMYGIKPPFNK